MFDLSDELYDSPLFEERPTLTDEEYAELCDKYLVLPVKPENDMGDNANLFFIVYAENMEKHAECLMNITTDCFNNILEYCRDNGLKVFPIINDGVTVDEELSGGLVVMLRAAELLYDDESKVEEICAFFNKTMELVVRVAGGEFDEDDE